MTLRVLHVTKYLPGFRGGLEHVTETMATVAVEAGAVVTVAGVAATPDIAERNYAQIALKGRLVIGPIALSPGFFRLETELAAADIVHVHLPHPLAELAILRFMQRAGAGRRCKIVPVVHAGIHRLRPLGRAWELIVERTLLSRADRIMVGARQNLNGFPGLEAGGRCAVIPFAVADAAGGSSVGAGNGPVQLLAIGRLVRYKGYDVLVRALAGLSGAWHLRIVGAGPEAGALRRLIVGLGLQDRVELLGTVGDAEKQALLGACDLFVAPSRTTAEAFGISIGEAFAHGRAVVTTDLASGVAFLARGGACGAVAEAGSVASLRQALHSLVTDPVRRRAAGRANRSFYEAELDIGRFASRYVTLLEDVAGRALSTEAPLKTG